MRLLHRQGAGRSFPAPASLRSPRNRPSGRRGRRYIQGRPGQPGCGRNCSHRRWQRRGRPAQPVRLGFQDRFLHSRRRGVQSLLRFRYLRYRRIVERNQTPLGGRRHRTHRPALPVPFLRGHLLRSVRELQRLTQFHRRRPRLQRRLRTLRGRPTRDRRTVYGLESAFVDQRRPSAEGTRPPGPHLGQRAASHRQLLQRRSNVSNAPVSHRPHRTDLHLRLHNASIKPTTIPTTTLWSTTPWVSQPTQA